MEKLDPFIIINNDIYGTMEYRVKCKRLGLEGTLVEDGVEFPIGVDGRYKSNTYPPSDDRYMDLLSEII